MRRFGSAGPPPARPFEYLRVGARGGENHPPPLPPTGEGTGHGHATGDGFRLGARQRRAYSILDRFSVGGMKEGGVGRVRWFGSAGLPPVDPSTALPPRRICDRVSGPAPWDGFTPWLTPKVHLLRLGRTFRPADVPLSASLTGSGRVE